jgi:hypothetical protein
MNQEKHVGKLAQSLSWAGLGKTARFCGKAQFLGPAEDNLLRLLKFPPLFFIKLLTYGFEKAKILFIKV